MFNSMKSNDNEIVKNCLAFAKHTPTAFIIESPFHLLCAWEAMAEFEIQEYCIVLVLEKNNLRNEQTFYMLREKKMSYDLYYMDDILSGAKIQEKRNYNRVMIGDYDDLTILRMAEYYASNASEVVFMDDGLSSVRVLKDLPYRHTPFVAKMIRLLKGPTGIERKRQSLFQHWEEIGIDNHYNMYTIYQDIKSRKFVSYPNTFSHLYKNYSKKQESVILIVGTLIDEIASDYGISASLLEGLLWDKLVGVRINNPTTKIIYIPHGRDYNKHIEQLCDILNIDFERLKVPIEYYVVQKGLYVKEIFGNTSTALSTLKIITKAPVTHWMIINKTKKHEYLANQYVKYYEEIGIQTDTIQIPE